MPSCVTPGLASIGFRFEKRPQPARVLASATATTAPHRIAPLVYPVLPQPANANGELEGAAPSAPCVPEHSAPQPTGSDGAPPSRVRLLSFRRRSAWRS